MVDEKQISKDRQLLNDINKTNEQRQIFTDKEAAEYLRIGQTTLWRLRTAGEISFRRAASKLIYTRADLDGYLERNKRDAFAVQN